MIDFAALKTVLYNWASANVPSGMPVIWLFPNAPRPTVDYVTLRISAFDQIGWDYIPQPVDEAGDVEQVGDREFTLQVEAYGGQAMQIVENLRTSLQKQTVLASLAVNGIAYFDWATINDLTELVDSRFEQRALGEFRFRLAQIYADVLGTIAQAQITEVILNVDGSTVLDQTVTIPETI